MGTPSRKVSPSVLEVQRDRKAEQGNMKTIWKWTLRPETTIDMPHGAKLLAVLIGGKTMNSRVWAFAVYSVLFEAIVWGLFGWAVF